MPGKEIMATVVIICNTLTETDILYQTSGTDPLEVTRKPGPDILESRSTDPDVCNLVFGCISKTELRNTGPNPAESIGAVIENAENGEDTTPPTVFPEDQKGTREVGMQMEDW